MLRSLQQTPTWATNTRNRPFFLITGVALFLIITFSIHGLSHGKITAPKAHSDGLSNLHSVTTVEAEHLPPSLAVHVPSTTPVWFIATMIPYFSITRRAIIRSTWQALYPDPDFYVPRFVVSRIPEPWRATIAAENATYGDIWELDWLEENSRVANTIKSIEFMKFLVRDYTDPATGVLPWKFITKIDDDSYLDVPRFREQFLEPLLAQPERMNRTMIGRECQIGKTIFAGGQFYTMTNDMPPLLKKLHEAHPIDDQGEDITNAILLREAKEKWTLVNLPNSIAFDYKDPKETEKKTEDGKKNDQLKGEWWDVCAAKDEDVNAWVHPVGKGSINPHKMKQDVDYLRVAAAFDEKGCRCLR